VAQLWSGEKKLQGDLAFPALAEGEEEKKKQPLLF